MSNPNIERHRNVFAQKTVVFLVFIYVVLSGYTKNDGSEAGILSRVVYADIFALFIIALFVFRFRWKFTKELILFAPLLFFAACSIALNGANSSGTLEVLILAFLWVFSIALYNVCDTYMENPGKVLLELFMIGSALLAIGGLVEFFLIPNIFGKMAAGGLTGTFRNTGQSGAFYGVALAVIIPGILSGMLRRNILSLFCALIIVFALIMTMKRSAYIGFAIGAALFLARQALSGSGEERKVAFYTAFLAIFIGLAVKIAFDWALVNVDFMAERYARKISQDGVEYFYTSFYRDNLGGGIKAFLDKPILGVGFGNIMGIYTELEIHSTYLTVLAQAGFLGFAAYATFIANWMRQTVIYAGNRTVNSKFLWYAVPFLFGLLISWSYTYHLRKREFWIAFVIISLVISQVRRERMSVSDRYPAC